MLRFRGEAKGCQDKPEEMRPHLLVSICGISPVGVKGNLSLLQGLKQMEEMGHHWFKEFSHPKQLQDEFAFGDLSGTGLRG